MGHNNDNSQFQMMPVIGTGQELYLQQGLYILVDKDYRSVYPLVTPWQIATGNLTRHLLEREHARVGHVWNIASEGRKCIVLSATCSVMKVECSQLLQNFVLS